MDFESIKQQTEFNSVVTMKNLYSLLGQNLVEKVTIKSHLVYSITIKGEKVARFFDKAATSFSPTKL